MFVCIHIYQTDVCAKSNREVKEFFKAKKVPLGDGPTAKGRCHSSLVIPSFPLCLRPIAIVIIWP